ncbi:SOM1 protein [Hyaloscypha sp. PMI_1271]|nr:SOM1 protein [Hyaloscypha sp. PMI_1271]
MMNNVSMGGMNAMGGPVGGGMPMMNNGAAGVRQPMPANDNRSQLNTYIYEYFLRNGMYDCARSLLNSDQPMNVIKDSPGRRRDENGGDEGADGDSKDDIDSKRPADLPEPNLPKECPESCFLYEWWCLFWDMFNAQRGKGDGRNVLQYVTHTQAQSRLRQEQQQAMLRGIRGDMQLPQGYQQAMMMRGQAVNNMNLNQNNELRQKAIQNNRNATPSMQMLAQQKQQQMQRDPSDGNNQQRPQSPGSAENAASPSKRPRLDQPQFNPGQMPNGRGQMPQQVGETGPSNAIQAAHMQLTNGIEPNNLTAQQFQVPAGANATAQRLAGYQANLAQQQATQMPGSKGMPNPGGPPNQGSPMMTQGQDGGAIANYYNPGEMGPNGMRGPGGQPGAAGGNHALQDYQMQLMLLEQQNKKRLMMARQEQDSMTIPRGPDGSGGQAGPGMGSNGQPFQGTSPQGPRSVNSPNPGDQMKRGTPHMNPGGGMPSPIPEPQSRGSPGAGMNFNIAGGPMDPSGMGQQYFNGGMPNGMRPPSSHPAPGRFNNQMTQQQMAMAQQQQAGSVQSWPNGPNGQMMPQQGVQGAPQQNMGTPQQRAMGPPSAPTTGAAPNGRTQTSSPQQNAAPQTPSIPNKSNPKKKNESKDAKTKRTAKKGSTAINAGATPSADAEATAATTTPQTPITPVHPKSGFAGQNGAVQPVTNGQPTGPTANIGVVSQPDPLQVSGFGLGGDSFGFTNDMEFAPNNGSLDVLQDFDFDSFLHQDGGAEDNFNFDTSAFLDENTIGAD